MAFNSMKSLALASAMAFGAVGVQAATISLFAVPGVDVANPIATASDGIFHENVVGDIDYPPAGAAGPGDATSAWNGTALAATGVYSSVSAESWAEFAFSAPVKTVLELVWGTVDFGNEAENIITFLLDGVATGDVITGAQIAALLPGGTQSGIVGTGVSIIGLNAFNGVRLSNSRTHDAFEFGNMTASVPLPAGGLLLISAVGAAAALRRRKTA